MPVKISDSPALAMTAVLTADFMWVMCLPPKYCEITTEQPMFMPFAIAKNNMVIGAEAPTAAKALTPI